MNSVPPSLRAVSRKAATSSGASRTGAWRPRTVCTAGRGRSAGSSRTVGAPARRWRQKPSCASSAPPRSHSRCQTAKSAYWIGSSGSRGVRPAANAG